MMDRDMEEKCPMPEIESLVLDCVSVEDAREKAAELWGIRPDDVEAKIISEDKKLFGFLGSSYKVEVKADCPSVFHKIMPLRKRGP